METNRFMSSIAVPLVRSLVGLLFLSYSAVCIGANDEKQFLTVDELLENGYTQLTGLQLIELLKQHKVVVRDIETEAVSLSTRVETEAGNTANRKSEDINSGNSLYFLDSKLLARAPSLEGEPDYTVVEDEMVATDGVRTYRIKFFEKQGKMYGARDIDNGNVFFEIIVK